MIFDKIDFSQKYYSINDLFPLAFDFFKKNNLNNFEAGTYEIKGKDIYLIIVDTKFDAGDKPKLEAHHNYIDIQMTIAGNFKIGWKSISECRAASMKFDEEHDYVLFDDEPDFNIKLMPGSFAIFFPEDAHMIYTPEMYVKKAILKVRIRND